MNSLVNPTSNVSSIPVILISFTPTVIFTSIESVKFVPSVVTTDNVADPTVLGKYSPVFSLIISITSGLDE